MCQAVAVPQGVKFGKILAERFARTVVTGARMDNCLFRQENPEVSSRQKAGFGIPGSTLTFRHLAPAGKFAAI